MSLSKKRMRELKSEERNVKPKTENVKPNCYPFITRHAIESVLDPGKRKKLESICESLKARNLLGEVRFGLSGPTMDIVSEVLDATN